jgi:gamma-glutamyltranspeptidase/glutathione hydrolase
LPALADSLERIATTGADAVYDGEIADAIVSVVRANGGLLTHENLASFEPEFVDPVITTYAGSDVYELPPNNRG